MILKNDIKKELRDIKQHCEMQQTCNNTCMLFKRCRSFGAGVAEDWDYNDIERLADREIQKMEMTIE